MLLSSLLIAALWLGPQDSPQPRTNPETLLEDVEVVGRRGDAAAQLETRIDGFVASVAAPIGHYGPARWYRRLCVATINFQPAAARQMIDRVSEVALELGLDPGDPGCRPHVQIFATNNGSGMATALADRDELLFLGGGSGMDLGRRALAQFKDGDRPVRWWHVSVPVDADTGQRVTRRAGDGADQDPQALNQNPPNVTLPFVASRIRSQYRDDLRNVVIIVDTSRLGEASFAQLTDYVALLAMAQVDPQVDARGQDTILNLFEDPTATPGLTAWDWAYLRALYEARLDTVTQNSRLGAVEREMQRKLTP